MKASAVSGHIDEIVPDLLVRAAHDPARVAALRHLAACPRCAQQWQEAAALFSSLGVAPADEPAWPSPAALQRTRELLSGAGFEARPLRSRTVGALGALVALLALVPLLVVAWQGVSGPFATASALGLLAAGLASLSLWRPRAAVLLPLASLGLAVAFGRQWALAPDLVHSFKCARLELVMALVPAALLLLVLHRQPSGFLRSKGFAGFAGAGALAGQAMLHVMCAMEPSLSHQLVFHVAPLFLAMTMAAAWNARRNRQALG